MTNHPARPDGGDVDQALAWLSSRAQRELVDDILPFWEEHVFADGAWIHGRVNDDHSVRDDIDRHTVIVARILWTFSAAARAARLPGESERWLASARRAYELLCGPCWDDDHGGVVWSVAPDRSVASDRKQTYAQAFAIYGLVEYHRATGEPQALARAMSLFELIEAHARDASEGGYLEALARDWSELDDVRLSPRDLNAPKSMNTHLHVLEAYTPLAEVTGDARVAAALASLLDVCLTRIVAHEPWAHCALFFDANWESLSPNISWGHDIEASWLLCAAAEAVADEALSARTHAAALALADAVLAHGVDPDGGVLYEGTPSEVLEPQKEWWPQAEAAVGFLNAYEISGARRFLDAALASWSFIEDHQIDRANGEWFAVVGRDGTPAIGTESSRKMDAWKCPYHNGRACLELARRGAPNAP